jgi:fatty-acyl-CoA synthase
MQSQLLLTSLLERAGRLFPHAAIISQRPDDSTHRYTYADLYRRARALAAALQDRGLRKGDRVATLMWNHYRHLEAYFGVPVVGGVLHTLNLRLHPDELAYIVNHAGDRFLIVDDVLLPVFAKIRDRVNLERVIVAPFSGAAVAAGAGTYDDYESVLDYDANPIYADLSETDPAGMCYTSGTTGKPKGVVYSHRSIALHSLSISLPDSFSFTRHDTVLAAMSSFTRTPGAFHTRPS